MESNELLKTDKRGRVWVPVERREALLDEFEKGGLSGAKFARLAGIKYATFANWVHGRRKRRGSGAAEEGAIRLVEAVLENEGNGPGMDCPVTELVRIKAGGSVAGRGKGTCFREGSFFSHRSGIGIEAPCEDELAKPRVGEKIAENRPTHHELELEMLA